MYEPFTDHSRKLMQLANQEAQKLNHEYIGTEHILLGLISEGSGTAVKVLKNLDVDLERLRHYVRGVIMAGPEPVADSVTLPQTPRGKKVIEYAVEECRNLKHNYVGTEHILMGLLRDEETVAYQVLMNHGLNLGQVRKETVRLLAGRPKPPAPRKATEDLPAALRRIAADLDAEIERLNTAKEEAVDSCDFETAAALRDKAHRLMRSRKSLLKEWMVRRLEQPSWLWNLDAAVIDLARRFNQERCWELLPNLADALELAGCTDQEIIAHCRQPGEHAGHCWVVDLLLAQT